MEELPTCLQKKLVVSVYALAVGYLLFVLGAIVLAFPLTI